MMLTRPLAAEVSRVLFRPFILCEYSKDNMNFTARYMCLLLLVYFVNGGEDFLKLIEVFRPSQIEIQEKLQKENDFGCVCVPYYLCPNDSVVTNGAGLMDIRAKEDPCENYLDVCCGKPRVESVKLASSLPDPGIGCGRHNPETIGFRITENENWEAKFGEFPWMVAVLKEQQSKNSSKPSNVYQCGGALIHPRVVLTAAHCVNVKTKKYKIRAGEWDFKSNKELYPHQDARVSSVVVHPEYYAGALYNDVALLFLESGLKLTANVDVVCLPRQYESFDHRRCFASGWGKDFFGKDGKYQVVLRKVELPIVPKKECEKALRQTRLGPFFNLHKSFICAGGEKGKDTCKGDGGSPLVCPVGKSNNYAQVGIVAWGIGCGENGTPGVYAEVASFRDWIDEQLLNNNLDTVYYEY